MSKLSLFIFTFLLSLHFASAAYDETIAKEYASASGLAYCDPVDILNWDCGIPCQNLTGYKPFFSQDFHVATAETLAFSMIYNPTSKKFLTIFRGTVGGEELLLEILEGLAVSYDLANVTGALADDYFYNHYVNTLRPMFIERFTYGVGNFSDYQFVFTGHSLGGALTTIAAFDAISSGLVAKEKTIMYTYGSPRVVNQPLAQAIQAVIPEIYRLTHWRDIVPHVPLCQTDSSGNCVPSQKEGGEGGLPATWPAWHLETEVFLNEDSTNHTICNGGEDPNCADQFSFPLQTTIHDHHYYLNIYLQCKNSSATSFRSDEVSLVKDLKKDEGLIRSKTGSMSYGFLDGNKLFGREFVDIDI